MISFGLTTHTILTKHDGVIQFKYPRNTHITNMNHQLPLELSNHDIDNSKINASIIWLHGLGADGYDFKPIAEQFKVKSRNPENRNLYKYTFKKVQ